ncbi:MAG TPA: hypothetical protein VJ740_11360, partial [Hyphomicrobiaceae bacterium]|nr:hypothetical protein [Hyphomicrobiaceae bacterium]
RTPLRLGIVSAHVRRHSVWDAILKGLMAHVDPAFVEVEVFHLGALRDGETQWAAAHAAHFDQGPHEPHVWAQRILARQPDVLLYPEIGMELTIMHLAAQRLAPVQAVTWGHPHTTGLPTIDCFFSAASLEPPDAADHYTERLICLPRLGCCITASRVDPEPIRLERLGIKTDAPLLLSPGTPYKYAPQHDWVFPAIAKRLGRCTIAFFKDPGAPWAYLNDRLIGRLSKAFAERGMRFADHCVVLPWQERAAYYALMQRADLMLDTIGFSGFNTAMQAMECGLPVVTRKGRFMRGRLAGGILQEMGLAELIAEDEAGYVNLAVEVASDSGRRTALRGRIEERRGALFNDTGTVRAFQDALLDIARR